MEIKKHSCKIWVFIINIFVVALAICGVKNKDTGRISMEKKTEEAIVPISIDIQKTQDKISMERENKLRDLNNTPKSIEQQNVTTTKTTAAPVPEKPKTPDKKTKTS